MSDDPRRESPVLPLAPDEADRLVGALDQSWAEAVASSTATDRQRLVVEVAGRRVALDGADPDLVERLTPALAHLRVEVRPGASGVSAPDLTIRVWSLGRHGLTRPHLPAVLGRFGDAAVRVGDDVVRARFDHPNRAVMVWRSATREAWWCIESTADLAWWEEAAPFRPIWSWFLPTHDAHLAHGAAVGTGDGAVLLVGPGGSGKSTTALACHLDGLGYLGDDYCVVTTAPTPVVHSLFGTAKLRLDAGVEHGPLAGHLLRPTPPPGGKAVALVSARPGAHLVTRAPVTAVAAIAVGSGPDTAVVDASRPQVLAALAPSSLTQLPGVGAGSLAALTTLVRSVPVCRIELGSDRAGVVAAVRALVADPSFRTPIGSGR